MPEKDIARLQRVQNCLAGVVTKAPRFSAQNIYAPQIQIDLLFLV